MCTVALAKHVLKHNDRTIIECAQMAQDAQAGYACDYCTKRQPMAFNEVKECCKGHTTMAANISREPVNTQGKRHAIRLLNDLYGKGIVRGQVENTNLRAYSRKDDITAAEAIMTCKTSSFYGRNYVDAVECLNDKRVAPNPSKYVEVDARSKRKGTSRFEMWLYCTDDDHVIKEFGICLHMNLNLIGRYNI